MERVYVTNSPNPQFYIDGSPIPPDVIAAMMSGGAATSALVSETTDGNLLIGHRDHGTPDGWDAPIFRKNNLNGITGKIPTVFFSLNCQTGRFDQGGGQESFAEKILRIDCAAPSLIACTRNSNTWLNNYLMKALFDGMWGGMLPSFPGGNISYPVKRNRLGDLLNYGKSYLPLQVGTYPSVVDRTVQDHLEIYHVLGDPTLELWKRAPRRVRLQAWIFRGYLYIRLSRCPAGATITVWDGGNLIKRTGTSSTTMRIGLRGLLSLKPTRRMLKVCFWAPGYRYAEVRPRMYRFPRIVVPTP